VEDIDGRPLDLPTAVASEKVARPTVVLDPELRGAGVARTLD
jgi:hypothetical protein